jgi:integrase
MTAPDFSLAKAGGGGELPAAISRAVALWAESSSDRASRRYADLVRLKRRAVESFFAHAAKGPDEARASDVRAWRASLEGRGLAPATVYLRVSLLASFFAWAMRDPALREHVTSNPARLARPKAPKAYQTEAAKALSDRQVSDLLRAVKAKAEGGEVAARRDYALLLFFLLSGMRREEVVCLRGEQLELREGGIVVTSRVKGGDYVARMLADPAAREALLDYLKASGREGVLAGGGPLWTRHDRAGRPGSGLTSHAFAKRMKRYAREAGIKHFHLHQTRHTFARLVAELSGSLAETQEALGHRNLATTRVYVQRVAVRKDKFSTDIVKKLKL